MFRTTSLAALTLGADERRGAGAAGRCDPAPSSSNCADRRYVDSYRSARQSRPAAMRKAPIGARRNSTRPQDVSVRATCSAAAMPRRAPAMSRRARPPAMSRPTAPSAARWAARRWAPPSAAPAAMPAPAPLIGAGAGLIAGTAIGQDNARRAASDVEQAYGDAYYACMNEADDDRRRPYAPYGPPPPVPMVMVPPGYYGPPLSPTRLLRVRALSLSLLWPWITAGYRLGGFGGFRGGWHGGHFRGRWRH